MATKKKTPRWVDVKVRLTDIERTGLIGLVQDLYAASKDNQAFLHARFALGDDVLKPYKGTITQWIHQADDSNFTAVRRSSQRVPVSPQ